MTATDLVIERGGFELRGRRTGGGEAPAVLCIHETATSAEVWRPLAAALDPDFQVAAYDRRGWGSSGAPPAYRRTTVEEHAADAEAVLAEHGAGPALVCGAGIGAVVALELALHRPALVRGALLVEPPLYALVPDATQPISADVEAIRRTAVSAGARLPADADPAEAAAEGARAALGLYLSGGLVVLGAGAERIPPELAAADRADPFALFAEVAAISGWTLPLAELPALEAPVAVAVARSTPPFVRRAAEALAPRLPGARLDEVAAAGLPQLDAAEELAALVRELA